MDAWGLKKVTHGKEGVQTFEVAHGRLGDQQARVTHGRQGTENLGWHMDT